MPDVIDARGNHGPRCERCAHGETDHRRVRQHDGSYSPGVCNFLTCNCPLYKKEIPA